MMWRNVVCISLVLVCQSVWGQEASDEKIEKIKALMVDEVQNEIESIYRCELELLARDYIIHFDLTGETAGKLKALAAEFATRKQKGHTDESIEAILVRKVGEFERIESFDVNGRHAALEGSEKESFVSIQVSGVSGMIFLSTKTGGSSANSQVKIDVREEPKWRESLSSLTDEQLSAYYEEIEKRQLQRLRKLMETLLAGELLATEEQIPALRDWLKEQVTDAERDRSFSQATQGITALDANLPECFTDSQKDVFRHLKVQFGNR